jgi:FtsP/CotA-like multicopper oxidase with cupredoxin domain
MITVAISRRRFLASSGLALISLRSTIGARGQSGVPEATQIDGFRRLVARSGTANLRGPEKLATAVWNYDDAVPGPVLRVKRGGEVNVRLVNELQIPTLIHWHGVRLPNAMDGVPHLTQAPIAPGATFNYHFIAPDAGTFWYHAPLIAADGPGRGLCGALVVDEKQPVDVDRDVTILLDHWRLDASGAVEPAHGGKPDRAARSGNPGEHLTVNGQPAADVAVRTNDRLRLRLVNAAQGRVFALRVVGHRATVMAIDGEPVEPFVPTEDRLALGPGNRLDLFVDATSPGDGAVVLLRDEFRPEPALVRLVYSASGRPMPLPDPAPLPGNGLPARMDFVRAVRVQIPIGEEKRDSGIGAERVRTLADPLSGPQLGAPLFAVNRGRTVMLAFANRTTAAHVMHVHGHHFRLLDALDDGWKPYWLDTLLVPPRFVGRIAFIADNPGKWLIEWHRLAPAPTPMAAWFEVT